ncbi:MAG: 4-(cytidine 5'-diphospho)-2-C-methyl-D-erythritol kinase [Rhodobacteraceae bacterium]|nr:4-(cytidine 5'-diphospho)-2-C-methyl-D-erythritol kinase [Paracoccaceae bacterium]
MIAPSSNDEHLTDLARAKVNLALHITGQRADGYHLLDSLVVFPAIADELKARRSSEMGFAVSGDQASALNTGNDNDNLVVKALRAFQQATNQPDLQIDFELNKALPVASGIGGGSADAAAALRLIEELSTAKLTAQERQELALSLGADVPVCLAQAPRRMEGIGELLSPLPKLPSCGMVLVNPGISVSTPAIFNSLACRDNPPLPELPPSFNTLSELIDYLAATRNDMQAVAETICPEITHVISALSVQPECKLARMSGSGATCFALCTPGEEQTLTNKIQKSHPSWWVASSKTLQPD